MEAEEQEAVRYEMTKKLGWSVCCLEFERGYFLTATPTTLMRRHPDIWGDPLYEMSWREAGPPNEEAEAEALDDHGHAAMEHREQGCVDSEQLERLAEMLNSSRAESAINGFAIFCSYQSAPVLTSLIKRQPRDFALQLVFFDESHRTV